MTVVRSAAQIARGFGIFAFMTISSACSDFDALGSPIGPEPASSANPPEPFLPGIDGEFARIAKDVPGFGGLHFDEDGAPVVAMRAGGRRDLAQRAVEPILRGRGRATSEIRYRTVEFDFLQLAEWRRHFPAIQSIEGVASTGIDERGNRLQIGVVDARAEGLVRAKLHDLGVPNGAVQISLTTMPRLFQSINTSKFRPVPGGVKIAFQLGNSESFCTLGFNAYTYGELDMKFLTNSHCTSVMGAVDYRNFYNPVLHSTNRVGVEVKDPPFLTGGACPSGFQCRYSDAAVVTYYEATGQIGKLARTTQRSTTSSGAKTINTASPRIDVVNTFDWPYIGETLDKVGVTSGWTTGQVFESCTDMNAGNGKWLWCQYKVAAGAWYGDSGSPVFYYYPNQNWATLAGILWGGPGISQQDMVFYMSPMGGLAADGIQITQVN